MNRTALPNRTDTVRFPAVLDPDPDTTVEFYPPWLLPPVTVTYGSPRRRMRDCNLTGHLVASARAAFYPLAVGCGVILAALVAVAQ